MTHHHHHAHHHNNTLLDLLGPRLLTKVGEYQEKPNIENFNKSFFHHGASANTTDALKGLDFVLLYFSAAWCPPCQKFSPLLKEFYKACKDDPEISLEIIYVSSDRDLAEFEAYYGKMPWLALESQHHKTILSRKCHVAGIPSLVVLDGQGRFVTDQARNEVAAAKGNPSTVKEVVALWKKMEAVPLEEATFSSSGLGCQIL